MNKPISEEMRRELEYVFAACATANPHMTPKDREQCREALDLVLAVVRGTLSRGVPSYIEGDDLVQECLIRLPDAIRAYRRKSGSSVKTYLKAVIRNDVMDFINHERRQPSAIAEGFETWNPGDESPALVDEYGLRIGWAQAALNHSRDIAEQRDWDRLERPPTVDLTALLTDEQLDVVAFCDLLDRSQKDTAELLGISRNAVASRLRKAHAKLRKAYSDHPVSKRRSPQPK
jgi:RNA polymerase sigma factor (sigma-70 family)